MDVELQVVLWVVGLIAVVVVTGGFWLVTATTNNRTEIARLDERVKLLTSWYLSTVNSPEDLTDESLLESALDSEQS